MLTICDFAGRSVAPAVKQVKISIPTDTVIEGGVLPKRFFTHNKRLDVLRVFAVADRAAILIAEIHRKDRLYTPAEVEEMRRELKERYNLEHFEVVDLDEERKVYTVLLRARIPDDLSEAWATVGTEAFLDGPIQVTPENATLSFVVLGRGEKPIDLLEQFNVPFEVKEVRKGPAQSPRDGLTREQRGLVKLALDLGYYEVPARVNLTQLARFTGVSKAAVSKKLRRAERKILLASVGRAR